MIILVEHPERLVISLFDYLGLYSAPWSDPAWEGLRGLSEALHRGFRESDLTAWDKHTYVVVFGLDPVGVGIGR